MSDDETIVEAVLELQRMEGQTNRGALRKAWALEEQDIEDRKIEAAKRLIAMNREREALDARIHDTQKEIASMHRRKMEVMRKRVELEDFKAHVEPLRAAE